MRMRSVVMWIALAMVGCGGDGPECLTRGKGTPPTVPTGKPGGAATGGVGGAPGVDPGGGVVAASAGPGGN